MDDVFNFNSAPGEGVVQSYNGGDGNDTLNATFFGDSASRNGAEVRTTFTLNPDGSFTATYFNHQFGDPVRDSVTITGVENVNISTNGLYTFMGQTFQLANDDIIRTGRGNDRISTFLGNDLIDSGQGDDVVDGGEGVDGLAKDFSDRGVAINFNLLTQSYSGPGGFTSIEFFTRLVTGSGNDTVVTSNIFDAGGQFRGDVVITGAGDDSATFFSGLDQFDGGAGSDRLIADYGRLPDLGGDNFTMRDLMRAGDGSYSGVLSSPNGVNAVTFTGVEHFTLTGARSNDVFVTGDGNDVLLGLGGNDRLEGGAGGDFLLGGVGNDTLLGGAGVDLLGGEDGDDSLSGGADGDNLYGAGGFDVVAGEAGDDFIDGGDVGDYLTGGDGADRVVGGAGTDFLAGDAGNDTLNGGDDGDNLFGGLGSDTAFGEAGDDLIYGGGANLDSAFNDAGDFILGGAGADRLFGEAGVDLLGGEDGNDQLYGGLGGDNIYGGAGFDLLVGDFDNDLLVGGDGDDTLIGGQGADQLNGGGGADRYVIFGGDSIGGAADRIQDFASGFDKVDVSSIDANSGVAGDQAFTFRGVQSGPGGAGTMHVGFIPNVGIFLFGYIDGDGNADVIIDIGTFGVSGGDLIL